MIEVIQPGLISSVQDNGRSHYAHIGVSNAGAIDSLSLHLANRLVENPANTPAIEIIQPPAQFLFHHDAWFSLTGSSFNASLDGQAIWRGWRNFARAGQRLTINPTQRTGFSIYFAVAGGFTTPQVLGSASTDLKSGFGGYNNAGLALRKGVQLATGEPFLPIKRRLGIKLPKANHQIKTLIGPEYFSYSPQMQASFWRQIWRLSSNSNRMGFRLVGDGIEQQHKIEMLSQGAFPGVVQVPPNGQPIILTAEAQSTGGYPRIAVVAQADLWKLGQLKVGGPLHFVQVSVDRAKLALLKQQNYKKNIEDVIKAAR